MFLSEQKVFNDFGKENWTQDIIYGDWNGGPFGDGTFVFESDYPVSENIKNNGSVYLHAYVTKRGDSPNPRDKNYAGERHCYAVKMLNK